MADVMGAFLEGRQHAQQEREHNQQLEENKLRMMVLKHQISGLKIEDTLRKRALQQQQLQLMTGQPESELPTEQVMQQNLPSRSMAGSMTGMPGAPGVTTELSPNAQDSTLSTNPITQRKGVTISGVPEWGVGDVNIRPRSMEDLVRASIQAKMMEPYNLPPDTTRMIGGQPVAVGRPRTTQKPAPTRASLELEAAGGDAAVAAKNLRPSGAQNNMAEEDVTIDGEVTKVLRDRQGNYFDLDHNPIRNPAARIKRAPPNQGAATPLQQETASRQEYGLYADTYGKAHPRPNLNDIFVAQQEGQPIPKSPKPPVTYEKWKVMTDEERQRSISNPDDRIDDKEMTARQEAVKAAKKLPAKGGAAKGEGAGEGEKFTPQRIATILKGQVPPSGKRRVTLADGTVWIVFPDGQYEQVLGKK